MNSNATVSQAVADFLNSVDQHLTDKSPQERREILTDLEAHIYEALDARAQGRQPTVDDLQAVLAELDPPESYGPLGPDHFMPTGAPPLVPHALRIVAYICLAVGILSAIEIVVKLFLGMISINTGLLGIPIFYGLLRLRNGWRICALVLLWFGLIGLPITFLLGLSGMIPAYFEIFGIRLARIHPWLVSLACIPFFPLALWQYRVLTRTDIKALFRVKQI